MEGGIKIKDNKKSKFTIVFIVVLLVIMLIFLLFSCRGNTKTDNAIITTQNSKLDFEPVNDEIKTIKIPGTNGINLKADSINQSVYFYNPNENNCYFVIELYLSDNSLIWRSNWLKPSESITNIELLEPLQKGIYKNCELVYNCYSINEKKPLNNGKVKIEINSK